MSHVNPRPPEETPSLQPVFQAAEAVMGFVPNSMRTMAHMPQLPLTDRQIVQIAGVIALFGFLNRWNDTLATELEVMTRDFAATALSGIDWQAGNHAP